MMTMSQVVTDELAKQGIRVNCVALPGQTHAEEVALDIPTTILSACDNKESELQCVKQ